MEAGVQLVNVRVIVLAEENPATPSKTAGVVAGDAVLLPVPLHVPEISMVLVNPFAIIVLSALCNGKDRVDTTGPVGVVGAAPPPPPHAVNNADALSNSAIPLLFTFNIQLPQ